jgi:hypothetical protein
VLCNAEHRSGKPAERGDFHHVASQERRLETEQLAEGEEPEFNILHAPAKPAGGCRSDSMLTMLFAFRAKDRLLKSWPSCKYVSHSWNAKGLPACAYLGRSCHAIAISQIDRARICRLESYMSSHAVRLCELC